MTSRAAYNLVAVRKLLLAAFTAETLPRFCADRPMFQPLLVEFGPKMGLDDIVEEVMTYCRTQDLWEALLASDKRATKRQVGKLQETYTSLLQARAEQATRIDAQQLWQEF